MRNWGTKDARNVTPIADVGIAFDEDPTTYFRRCVEAPTTPIRWFDLYRALARIEERIELQDSGEQTP